jgi:hypothetical protein
MVQRNDIVVDLEKWFEERASHSPYTYSDIHHLNINGRLGLPIKWDTKEEIFVFFFLGMLLIYELVDWGGIASLSPANQVAAIARTSRSWRNGLTSRRKRRSSSSSLLVIPRFGDLRLDPLGEPNC